MRALYLDLFFRFHDLMHGEDGQDLTEYALLVALIALVCITGVSNMAAVINGIFGGSSGPIPTPAN